MSDKELQNKKNTGVLLTILLMPFITIAASALLFYMAKNDIVLMRGTQNNGVLVQPPFALNELPLLTADQQQVNFDSQPKKWRFLLITDQYCGEICQESLWETRQIRLALGKFESKVERAFIHIGSNIDKTLLSDLQENHKDTQVFLLKNNTQLNKLLQQRSISSFTGGRVFIIDPKGFVMMFFDPTTDDTITTESGRKLIYDYKAVMQDINHLIKLN